MRALLVLLSWAALVSVDATLVPHKPPLTAPGPPRLVWCAPFLSGGGLCDEAVAFGRALRGRRGGFAIVPHGDSINDKYVAALDDTTVRCPVWRSANHAHQAWGGAEKRAAADVRPKLRWCPARSQQFRRGVSFGARRVECAHTHGQSERCNCLRVAYSVPPIPQWKTPVAFQCPPPNQKIRYTVGRCMFETDQLPRQKCLCLTVGRLLRAPLTPYRRRSGWLARFAFVNELWVPTHFHRQVFIEAGVAPHKVVVMPEPVNVDWFNPARVTVRRARARCRAPIFIVPRRQCRRRSWCATKCMAARLLMRHPS